MMRTRFRTHSAVGIMLALTPALVSAQPVLPPSAPAPSMAPTTLPPVSIPVTAPAAPAVAAPAVTPAANADLPLADVVPPGAAAPQESLTSMGSSKVSVFFSPVQMQAVEEALKDYESNVATTTAPKTDLSVDLAELQQEAAPKIVEPGAYPVFYLSSIAYRSPGDWSIWVSGHKITAHKNTTNLQIVSVTPNQVSFAWKPSYSDSIASRKASNMLAPVDPVKNKLSKPATFNFDTTTGIVTFTLRPNQSFVVGYMNIFEGFVESPKLPALATEKGADTALSGQATPAPRTGPGASSPDVPVGPSETIQNMSVSASRREIDAQLQREKTLKPQQ